MFAPVRFEFLGSGFHSLSGGSFKEFARRHQNHPSLLPNHSTCSVWQNCVCVRKSCVLCGCVMCDRVECERIVCVWKRCVWQSCVMLCVCAWRSFVWKSCESCVTKMGVKELRVTGLCVCVWKSWVCVCERLCVWKSCVWKRCVKELCVTLRDKVVCVWNARRRGEGGGGEGADGSAQQKNNPADLSPSHNFRKITFSSQRNGHFVVEKYIAYLYSPQLCVEFLFLILYPESPPPPPAPSLTHIFLSTTIFVILFTHNSLTSHTHLCPPPSLSHTQLTYISHTSSPTTIFVTHTIFSHTTHLHLTHIFLHHHLCHTLSFTHNSHTTLSTIFHTSVTHKSHTSRTTHLHLTRIFVRHHLCHTLSFTHNSHTTLSTIFAWQAWHLVTSTFVSRGRRGTWSHPGVALGHICLRFAWQAWHLWHWVARLEILVAGDAAALCVAGVALMALGGALGSVLVADDAAALCVAGVALGHSYLRFAWQAWQAWHLVTSTFVLRGRRGTYGTGWRAWVGF